MAKAWGPWLTPGHTRAQINSGSKDLKVSPLDQPALLVMQSFTRSSVNDCMITTAGRASRSVG